MSNNQPTIEDVSRPYEGSVQLESEPTVDYPSAAEVSAPVDYEPLHVHADMPQTSIREDILWAGGQMFVDTRPVQLVGRDVSRRRLVVLNTGSATVYLKRNQTDSIFLSFALPMNQSIELLHNDSVYAQCGTGDETTLSVASEFVLRD